MNFTQLNFRTILSAKKGKTMADKNLKNLENVPGKFYVDNTCIDCDQCRNVAPQIFKREETAGYSFVYHQPQSAEELTVAEEGMNSCPTSSIGCDGE
jgi:ferredoxin